MSKQVIVDIDSEGNMSVDILGGIDGSCKAIADAFKTMGKVTKDVKKPEYYRNPNQNKVQQGK